MSDDFPEFNFDALKAELASDKANEILDRHVRRTGDWMAMRRADGGEPTLLDLIKKINDEPSRRRMIIAAYGAALWRLIHQEVR